MSEFEGRGLAAETAGEELRAGRIVIFDDPQDLESLGDELTAKEGSIFIYKETLEADFCLLFLWVVV